MKCFMCMIIWKKLWRQKTYDEQIFEEIKISIMSLQAYELREGQDAMEYDKKLNELLTVITNLENERDNSKEFEKEVENLKPAFIGLYLIFG